MYYIVDESVGGVIVWCNTAKNSLSVNNLILIMFGGCVACVIDFFHAAEHTLNIMILYTRRIFTEHLVRYENRWFSIRNTLDAVYYLLVLEL